jgi:hypothetical protein
MGLSFVRGIVCSSKSFVIHFTHIAHYGKFFLLHYAQVLCQYKLYRIDQFFSRAVAYCRQPASTVTPGIEPCWDPWPYICSMSRLLFFFSFFRCSSFDKKGGVVLFFYNWCSLSTPFSTSILQMSLSLSLSLMLRPMVSRPICLGIKHPSGLTTRFLLPYGIQNTSDSCGFVDMGRSLWREDGSVVCNCFWS